MPTDSVLPQDQPNHPPQSHLLVLLAILILVLSSSLYYYLRVTSPELLTGFPDIIGTLKSRLVSLYPSSPSPSPQNQVGLAQRDNNLAPSKPPYTLPSGPQTYRFSHGKDVTGPKVQVVTFDPLDPAVGSTQTITLEIDSPSPLKSATITLTSDNQEKTLDLERTSGDTLKGTYQTPWVVDDTFELTYAVHYLLLSENDKFDNTMYIR